MAKTILVTGSTDGIGLETAKILVLAGHFVLLHGRNASKLAKAEQQLGSLEGGGRVGSFVADLSSMSAVVRLAREVAGKHQKLDVLINNAGVLKTPETRTADGLDVRFAVNAIAPYLLTKRLLPLIPPSGRIINLSSAAQSPVDLASLTGEKQARIGDMPAYAQSKLAITMWSRSLAKSLGDGGPLVVAVNPGSLLGSKMVKEGFGVAGGDLRVGADILTRAVLSDEFEGKSGSYFDNDKRRFAEPHPDGVDEAKCDEVVRGIEGVLVRMVGGSADART